MAKPHGQTRALKNFAPGGLCAPKPAVPELPYVPTFGAQVVEALTEFVDAKIDYERSRSTSGAEWANPEPVSKAGERLQELLDKVGHV